VLNLVENNPHIGSREISSQIGISKSSVLRILKKQEYHPYYGGQKMLAVIVCQFKKKKLYSVLYCHHDYRLDYKRYFLGGKFQNSKLFCHFYYTERLPLVIYVRLL
jgi:hypothetical protein